MQLSAVLMEGVKTALPTVNADLYQLLRARGIPVLFLHGTYCNLGGFPSIQDDNYSGGYQLTRYLLSKGHTRIAGIFKSDDAQGPQRYHGMLTALRDAGVPIRDEAVVWFGTRERSALVGSVGQGKMADFLGNRLEDSTAVVCYNDEIAYLVIRQLLAAGKRVPEDVAVVSFDNSFYSQIGPVPITSLGHKASRTGKAAAAALLQMLSGSQPDEERLEWELFVRASG